jgi:hypothetical protein
MGIVMRVCVCVCVCARARARFMYVWSVLLGRAMMKDTPDAHTTTNSQPLHPFFFPLNSPN